MSKSGGTFFGFKQEYISLPVAGSGPVTLVNLSNGPGYLSDLQIGIAVSGDDLNALNNSLLTIVADGETVFNDRIVLYFGAEYSYNNISFMSQYFGANRWGGGVGFFSSIPIPYSSTLVITLTNGSGTNWGLCFVSGSVQAGVLNTWPRTRKLHCVSGTLTGLVCDQVVTLINATGLSQGRFLGAAMSFNWGTGGGSENCFEGNVEITVDGSTGISIVGGGGCTYSSGGTEDYFHMCGYFGNLTAPTITPYFGLTLDAGNIVNAYRFHIPDPIYFQNALKFVWHCGDSTEGGGWGGTVRLAYCIWYYTE
jgi:hypothetical protein